MTHSMTHLFKDKEQPDTEDNDLNSVPFNAQLAIDDPNASTLSAQPGADGFQMDSTPLFQVLPIVTSGLTVTSVFLG